MPLPVINIVCDGNSLTNGYGSSAVTFGSSITAGSYPSQLQALLTSNVAFVQNLGVNGQTTTQMATRASSVIDPLYNGAYPLNLLIAFEIGNDILVSPYVTPSQAYTNFVNYCLARKAAGWKVAIMTIPSRDGTTTATGNIGTQFDSVTRPYINNLLRTNWASFSDFLIDIAADFRLYSYSNTTYYTTDRIHYVDAGYNVLASYAAASATALLYGNKQLSLKQLIGQLYTPATMATTAFSSVAYSGTTFTVDVTSLGLSSNLSVVDYQVLQGSTDVTNYYSKTSQSQLTYSGLTVAAGTKLTFYRKTPINTSEVTFTSTTTASGLTNALSKLLLRVQELEAKQTQLQSQLTAGGIALAPTPVIDQAYGISWSGDINNAPSRNSTYAKLVALDATLAGINTSVFAPIASPNFTGNPTAPTIGTTDSSTSLATTAWVKKWVNVNAGMRIGGLAIAGNNQVVTPSASGQVTISVSAFNFNGYFTAIVGNGDSNVAKNYTFSIDNTNTNATQLVFYVWNATTNAAVTTAVRVAWVYYGSYTVT